MSTRLFDLKGKTAIVTPGNGGIGLHGLSRPNKKPRRYRGFKSGRILSDQYFATIGPPPKA